MPVNPKDFFVQYVIAPYTAWCDDELCEWKAFATAGGLNALVEHLLREANPTDTIGTAAYGQKLGDYRQALSCSAEHWFIQYAVETYKHVERKKPHQAPKLFDDMQVQEAGAFSKDFSSDFDTARQQIGFPYKQDYSSPEEWIPLRAAVDKCIAHWKDYFGIV